MQIASRWAGSALTMSLAPEPGDPLSHGSPNRSPALLTGTVASFRPPVTLGPEDVHPDVEALLGLLVVQPFAGPPGV
jgi:hypothetical protein